MNRVYFNLWGQRRGWIPRRLQHWRAYRIGLPQRVALLLKNEQNPRTVFTEVLTGLGSAALVIAEASAVQ